MEIVGPLLDRAVSPGTRNAPTLPSFPLLPPPFHLFHPHPIPSPSPAPPSIHFPHNPHLLYSISPTPFTSLTSQLYSIGFPASHSGKTAGRERLCCAHILGSLTVPKASLAHALKWALWSHQDPCDLCSQQPQ